MRGRKERRGLSEAPATARENNRSSVTSPSTATALRPSHFLMFGFSEIYV